MQRNSNIFCVSQNIMTVLVQAVAGVVVFEADSGKRIACSYFDPSLRDRDAQVRLEKELLSKAGKSSAVLAGVGGEKGEKSKEAIAGNSSSGRKASVSGEVDVHNEVVLVDNFLILLRLANDVLIAVVARDSQNDLLMAEYLNTVHACLSEICTQRKITKKHLFDKLDQVFLVFDESIENGSIFETDPQVIVARIQMQNEAEALVASNSRSQQIQSSVRDGIAAISRGDTDSLRSLVSGAAQSWGGFFGR